MVKIAVLWLAVETVQGFLWRLPLLYFEPDGSGHTLSYLGMGGDHIILNGGEQPLKQKCASSARAITFD